MKLKNLVVGGLALLAGAYLAKDLVGRMNRSLDEPQIRTEMVEDWTNHRIQSINYRDSMFVTYKDSMYSPQDDLFLMMHQYNSGDWTHQNAGEINRELNANFLRLDSLFHNAVDNAGAIKDSLDNNLLRTEARNPKRFRSTDNGPGVPWYYWITMF